MSKIVVVGSLNMDLVAVAPRLPLAGETVTGTQFLSTPGGKGANQAYAAARLGGAVAMLGRVGSDEYGPRMRDNLAAAGCEVGGVASVPGASGVAVIYVSENSGQNSIVVIPGANHRYLPEDLYLDEHRLRTARFVMLQLEIPIQTVEAAAKAARRLGVRVILDPAPAPHSLSPELLRHIDILTPNETEALRLAGHSGESLGDDDAVGIARQLQSQGARTVIIKLGSRGCLLAEAGGVPEMIPAPKVSALDTTAAGDVFNAGLAVACTEGMVLKEACAFAVQAAALSVTRLGAQTSMPTRSDVTRFAATSSPAGAQ